MLDPAQLPPGQYNVSIASVYTDYGLPIACGGVLHVPQLGVANKTLPCGTMVTFRYGGRAIRVPVIDRGPYIAGREWDLTGAAAEALQFPRPWSDRVADRLSLRAIADRVERRSKIDESPPKPQAERTGSASTC